VYLDAVMQRQGALCALHSKLDMLNGLNPLSAPLRFFLGLDNAGVERCTLVLFSECLLAHLICAWKF
jgi:hypothetical protein